MEQNKILWICWGFNHGRNITSSASDWKVDFFDPGRKCLCVVPFLDRGSTFSQRFLFKIRSLFKRPWGLSQVWMLEPMAHPALEKWHLFLLHKLEYIFASCCAVWAAHTDIKHLFSPYPHKKRFIQFGMDFEGCFHSCLQYAAAAAVMLELRQNIAEAGKTPYRYQHSTNRIWTFIQNRFGGYTLACASQAWFFLHFSIKKYLWFSI